MEDQQIIRLFFERSEQAITELSRKYGALCFQIADNILDDPQRNASTTPGLARGTVSPRSAPIR